MKVGDVIDSFVDGEQGVRKASSVMSTSRELFSYDTLIALRCADGVMVNCKKYSRTTSTMQNALLGQLQERGYRAAGETQAPSHGVMDQAGERVILPLAYRDRDGHEIEMTLWTKG